VRRNSHDVALSGFKGNNKEGKRRRRLDYELARGILERALSEGNSGARNAINRYNDRIFAGTSGEAIIWLSSLT
ncbi:MAG: hypothetical protein VYD50_00345, partial [Candidatus Thermoplasmatota archaeon]|nr:hypothetical protein [Candidatus Thermoplasmatota archaeon]